MAKNKRRGPGKGLVGGRYKPLTDEQVKQIHEASLTILKRTGVQVEGPEQLRLFEEAGAEIDGDRVRLSQSFVEDALDKAPSRVVLAGRDPKHDLILKGARKILEEHKVPPLSEGTEEMIAEVLAERAGDKKR